MRRSIANALLLVTLGIFFAPALTAFTTPPVPLCCRRGGAHHCAMMAEMMIGDQGTSFRADNPCPMRQASQLGSSVIALPVSRTTQVELHRQLLVGFAVSRRYFTLINSTHSRGPPPNSL
jgi:hypothetical protein